MGKTRITLLLFSCFLLFGFSLMAQTRLVTGKVQNSKGEPIPFATVQEKGTTNGVMADKDGGFSITVSNANAVLIISSTGFQDREISVGSTSDYSLTLTETGSLDEVMVVAYGTATKRTFTGSASVIKPEAIKDIPVTSFENALTGRVPGLQVTQSSGQAGAISNLRIRGIGSMNASNEPLYVIDGVPVVSGSGGQLSGAIYATNNVMNNLNPADIESITILKDAAASALYGSRAANGIVVITTKNGKAGKPLVSLKSSIGFTPSWATDNYEAAGVQEQVNMLYQVFHDYNTTGGSTEQFANSNSLSRLNTKFNRHGYTFSTNGTGRYENVVISGMTDGIENREGKYFNWDDVLFRTGLYNTNDLSVSGGSAGTKYYASVSYTKDQSRIIENGFDRISGRVNLNQKVGKFVELMSNVSVSSSKQTGFNDTRNLGGNVFFQTRNLLWSLYWPTDYKTGLPFTARLGSLAYNNEYYRNEWENGSKNVNLNAVGGLTVHFTSDLRLKSILSYNDTRIREFLYYSPKHFNGQSSNGSISEYLTDFNKLVSSTTLNYSKQFNVHGLDLLAGYEAEKNVTDFMRSTGTDLPSEVVHTVATAGVTSSNAYNWGYNLQSVLSRAEYNYDQKYYASFSFRRDGSSRLAPDTRWGNFWSVGASWRMDKEDFIKNIKSLSHLTLRASYGVNGTMPSSNYGWRALYNYTNNYMGSAGGSISTAGNEGVKWETNHTADIALEFGFFNQRFTGSVEYFNRKSKDLLLDVPTSLVTGFSSVLSNVGQITNKGLELELGGDIIRKKDFRWGASLNVTFLKSNVDRLYRSAESLTGNDIIWSDPTGGDARAQYIFREGNPYLSFYGYEWGGVDADNGKNVWYVNDPEDKTAGDFLHNGRGATYTFGTANRVIIGNATPKAYGGIFTDLEYKDFSLGFNFIYKIGGDLYDGALKDVSDDGYYWERIRAQYTWDNMWTENNKSGTLPLLSGNDLTDPIQSSTRNLFNASFLRLKNVTLAYKLPRSIMTKIGLSNGRLFVNGTNLLTMSKYKIADPEVNQYGTRGWETPYGKTYTFGIEVSF